MEAKIRDVLGCERADIKLTANRISLIIGKNFNGKSSIAKVIGGLLTNRQMPNGHDKKDAISMVKKGREEGTAMLCDDAGASLSLMAWRKGGVVQEGEVNPIGGSSAGFLQFSKLDTEKRAAALIKLVGAEPTEKDLRVALKDALGARMISEERFTDLWQRISTLGWVAVHKSEEEKQRTAKAKWCGLTGKRVFAEKDGIQWTPDNWEPITEETKPLFDGVGNIGGLSDTLTPKVAALNLERDGAIASQAAVKAVDESRKQELQDRAAKLPELEAQIKTLEEQKSTIALELTKAKAELLGAPAPAAGENTHPCPHCQKDLVIRGGKPEMPKTITEGERKKQQAAHDAAAAKVKGAEMSVSAADQTIAELRREVVAATKAKQELEAPAPAAKPAYQGRSLVEIDAELLTAKRQLEHFKAKHLADKFWTEAADQIKIVNLLAPDGLQQRKLGETLGEFNDQHLRPLTEAAGWRQIKIEPDMSIIYDSPKGGMKEYRDISESEQWRTDAILQIAFAQRQGDSFIIMDRAELLDAQGRGELFKLLASKKIGAVVCMTANKPSDCPDLASKHVGITYFMEDGIATPVAELSAPVPA